MAQVGFDGVTKRFGDTTAVDDLTLHVADGERFLLGTASVSILGFDRGNPSATAIELWNG